MKALVGEISSGTFSPLSNKAIGLAYLRPDAENGLWIEIRNRAFAAELVSLPLYKKKT